MFFYVSMSDIDAAKTTMINFLGWGVFYAYLNRKISCEKSGKAKLTAV